MRDATFDPVDPGPLRVARYTEPFALLIGQLAYEGAKGPKLAYRLSCQLSAPGTSFELFVLRVFDNLRAFMLQIPPAAHIVTRRGARPA